MTTEAGSGHVASSFSAADIMAVLFCKEMRINPLQPNWPQRDRFVLSKGHAAPILYAALREANVIDDKDLLSLRKIDSPLQGHPSGKMVGVDATTGSLGTGLSQAVGMALGSKMAGMNTQIYALVGDGECEEGQIWEAIMAAAFYKLNNLVVFVDNNHYQVDGKVCDVMGIEPLAPKWEAFGWRVEQINGHDYKEIIGFLDSSHQSQTQPSVAIADTIKGYGVSFIADGNKYHAKVLNSEEAILALEELDKKEEC